MRITEFCHDHIGPADNPCAGRAAFRQFGSDLVTATKAMKIEREKWIVRKAIEAVEEVAQEAQSATVKRTIALRVVLAILASRHRCERWPFDNFWQAVAMKDDVCRRANVLASLNAINRVVAVDRQGRE